jgi:hypothetical protein
MDVVETQWRDIRSTIGVSHFISFDDYPAPLPDGIVEAIIAREDGEGYVGLFHEHAIKKAKLWRSWVAQWLIFLLYLTVLMDLLGHQVRVRVPLKAVLV